MKTGILVQGNQIRGVGGAEDVAAMAAVVTAEEEAKRGATGCGVAVGRRRVGLEAVSQSGQQDHDSKTNLPVIALWMPGNLTEIFVLHPFIHGQLGDPTRIGLHRRPAADGLVHVVAVVTIVAVVVVVIVIVAVGAVQGTMYTARRRGRGGFLMMFRGAQGSRNV